MPYPNNVQVSVNGQLAGPYSVDHVRSLLSTRAISTEDHVWGEGMPEWVTVEAYLLDAPLSVGATAMVQPELPQVAGGGSLGESRFIHFVIDALSYPFRGDGLLILCLGTLLFTGLNFLGRFSIFLTIAGWGYLLLMLQDVIHGTASEEKVLPSWPDFDGFGELLGKWFQFFATLAVCFAPGIFVAFQEIHTENPAFALAGLALIFLGLLYFPMAILCVAMFDTLGALNPVLVIKSILVVKGHYAVTLVIMTAVLAIQYLTTGLSKMLPIIGHLVDELDALWSAVFVARVLGGLYLVNRRKLGWF